MKVSKKDELLARALLETTLLFSGFPYGKIEKRVNEGWPGKLNQAKNINKSINQLRLFPLDGETTQAEIEKWS